MTTKQWIRRAVIGAAVATVIVFQARASAPVAQPSPSLVHPPVGPATLDLLLLADKTASLDSGRGVPHRQVVELSRAIMDGQRNSFAWLPVRNRVAYIGDTSLDQPVACDIVLPRQGVFVDNDPVSIDRKIEDCTNDILRKPTMHETDITGAIQYAARMLGGAIPRGHARVVVVMSDLRNNSDAAQSAEPPDLAGICVVVYSVVTQFGATHPAVLAQDERTFVNQLRQWGARDVFLQPASRFNMKSLQKFLDGCRQS